MKKSILMLSVIFLVIIQSKAQEQSQFITAYPVTATKPLSFSMRTYNSPDKDADFYMQRSKNYRIVGWTTLGAGLLASGAGLLIATNSSNTFYNDANDNAAAIFFLAGALSGITSIPFMIMATSYKYKAKAMITSQKTGFGVPGNVSKDITGITLTIPIGN